MFIWHSVEIDGFLFQSSLANYPFTPLETALVVLPEFISIACQQVQAVTISNKESSHLKVKIGCQVGQDAATHEGQILISLQQRADLGNPGFEPIPLVAFIVQLLQGADHVFHSFIKNANLIFWCSYLLHPQITAAHLPGPGR